MRRRRNQTGFVLMDTLVTAMLIAVTFLGLLGALFTAVKSSDANRHRQRMEAALTSFGESVKTVPYYEDCAFSHQPHTYPFGANYTSQTKASMGWTDPADMQVTVLDTVEVLAPDGTWTTSCPPPRESPSSTSEAADPGAQRLTIEVASRGRTLTGHVVKTRPLS